MQNISISLYVLVTVRWFPIGRELPILIHLVENVCCLPHCPPPLPRIQTPSHPLLPSHRLPPGPVLMHSSPLRLTQPASRTLLLCDPDMPFVRLNAMFHCEWTMTKNVHFITHTFAPSPRVLKQMWNLHLEYSIKMGAVGGLKQGFSVWLHCCFF